MPPIGDWRDQLAACHDFVSKPVRWSRFVSFPKTMPDHISRGGFFSKKYSDRLSGFSQDDLWLLATVFERLLRSRAASSPTELTEQQAQILDRAIVVVGDLKISSTEWGSAAKLETFRIR